MKGKTPKKSSKSPKKNAFKKQYLKSKPICRVTFRLSKGAAPDAKRVAVVGDFNDWNEEAMLMKKLKNGDFTLTLELMTGKEYRFKYLIDGHRWENDWNADRYQENIHGTEDSVVVV